MIPIEMYAASAQYGLQNGGGQTGTIGSGGTARSGGISSSKTSSGGNVTNTNQQAYDPWSKYRASAGDKLAQTGMSTNDPSNFYRDKLQAMSSGEFNPNDPSYQWRFDQGQQAAERSLAARGLLNSGNAAIELQAYGQGAASQEYGAQFTRMLQGLAGVSAQYDQQQQRLMAMAGINLDPTAGAKLGIMQQEANTNEQQVANSFQVGMANARNSGGGGSQLQSYQIAQNKAQEDALESSLFFGRKGGLSDSSSMWGINGGNL